MITKIYRLVLLLASIGLALYLVLLNRADLTVTLSPNLSFTATSGVILIATFCFGLVSASIFAFYFGIKAYFRESLLKSREKRREAFFQQVLKARGFMAAGETNKAIAEWEKILSLDKINILALLELSRCHENQGQLREALKAVDQARHSDGQNLEALYRAADLNIMLGNKTAAVDNLALAIYQTPTIKALNLARNLSEDLGRFEDALEYDAQLRRLGGVNEDNNETKARLEYKKILQSNNDKPQDLALELVKHLKQFPNFCPGMVQLSNIRIAEGKLEEASSLVLKAAKINGDSSLWQQNILNWLAQGSPEQALSAARLACRETEGEKKLLALLDLSLLQLHLSQFEQAEMSLKSYRETLEGISFSNLDPLEQNRYLVASCLCFLGRKDWQALENLLSQENPFDINSQVLSTGRKMGKPKLQPAARLSTP